MKDFTDRFYNRPAWMACRSSFIRERQAIDGGLCQHCGQRLGYIVHHLECHNKEHGVFQPAERRVMFDDDGNVIDVIDREPRRPPPGR